MTLGDWWVAPAMTALALVALSLPFYRGLRVCLEARAATRRMDVGELLPNLSRVMDRATVVRSLTHPYPIHGVAFAATGIPQIDVAMELSPRDGRHCDDHPGTELIQRVDDAEATVRRRLAIYAEQTEPLIEYYRSRGRLSEVRGIGTMDEVYRGIREALGLNGA